MGMFPNACFLALGYNCCAQVMGVLYFLANPTDLQELEEGLHILANLSDVNRALGIYFCNRIKKVTCRTPDCLTLHRLCVSMLAVPQRFVWQVMLPSLFIICLEMFIVRIEHLVAIWTLMILIGSLNFFLIEAFTNLCGNT